MAYLPTIEEVDESNKSPVPRSPRASLNPNYKDSSSTGFMYDRNRGCPPLGKLKQNTAGNAESLSEGSDITQKRRFVAHSTSSNVTLMEDCFGLYMVNKQTAIKVWRFTWRSSDNVVVQLITYGARIVTMKYPDKNGTSADIVLGFQDLAGYLYHEQHYIGATIGAVTDRIKLARYDLDGKHTKLTENDYKHYYNGGTYGLDKVVWNSCVIKNQVVLTHVIPHKHEGLPGPVMIKITYELSAYNEFHINMEAKTGRPTIINLSNLCYFNLGGHNGGPEELKKHSVTINCNCYTLMDNDDLPTGKIMNVVHTRYDFTKPKLMKNCLDVEPDDGFYQTLCVNRATAQGNCLVARVVHTTNGRVLEIYSNQYGVKFNTANEFSLGVLSPPSPEQKSLAEGTESIFVMLDQMFRIMESLELFDENNFQRVHRLLIQIRGIHMDKEQYERYNYGKSMSFANPDFCIFSFLHALQQSAYAVQNMIPKNVEDVRTWSELKLIIKDMHDKYVELDTVTDDEQLLGLIDEHVPTEEDLTLQMSGLARTSTAVHGSGSVQKSQLIGDNILSDPSKSITGEKSSYSSQRFNQKILSAQKLHSQPIQEVVSETTRSNITPEVSVAKDDAPQSFIKSTGSSVNEIPSSYKDGRIHGKFNAIYARHGAMAFQTQNYPDAIHHSNFPSPILRPGETYTHSIIYKFSTKYGNLAKLRSKRCR